MRKHFFKIKNKLTVLFSTTILACSLLTGCGKTEEITTATTEVVSETEQLSTEEIIDPTEEDTTATETETTTEGASEVTTEPTTQPTTQPTNEKTPDNTTKHHLGSWEVTKEATCTEKGEKERKCKDKGCDYTETQAVPAKGHSFNAWKVTKEATCNEKGEKTRDCKVCAFLETQTIPAGNHSYGDWKTTREATCTEKGEKTRTCKNCGNTETQAIAAGNHSYSDWKTTKNATCTEKGEKTRTCKYCSNTETQTIAALGHSFQKDKPTCTRSGCNEKNPNYEEPVTAHTHNFETVSKTKISEYEKTETKQSTRCSVCKVDKAEHEGEPCGSWQTYQKPTGRIIVTTEYQIKKVCSCGEKKFEYITEVTYK